MPMQLTDKWFKKDHVVYFQVGPTTGITGPEWIRRHERHACYLTGQPRKMMESPEFITTTGVIYNVAVICGTMFPTGRIHNQRIREEADNRKLLTPPHELSCLISEKFSDVEIKAMGLNWIIVANGPINGKDIWMGPLVAIGSYELDLKNDFVFGTRSLATVWDPDEGYSQTNGFAFVESIEQSP